ncbi:hypothetical protein I8748_34600 [Nostoc sp. CENA67]|uniref:Uncharacterized protein n=1 Tax=Amazonocrinis nigriterrae CENA67 TaxID=2794033 RepID=A0A8J7HWC6_9NOST|nr:hypothetical protein [Amazonocrinis nigriterrae]MBH8567223.1 hypothetical protein [Amazonocrinis nigriterrae CENA67]
MMDFLSWLSVSLPGPIFGLAVAIMVLLLTFACAIGLWLFLYIIALIPGTDFLFVDIEEKLSK